MKVSNYHAAYSGLLCHLGTFYKPEMEARNENLKLLNPSMAPPRITGALYINQHSRTNHLPDLWVIYRNQIQICWPNNIALYRGTDSIRSFYTDSFAHSGTAKLTKTQNLNQVYIRIANNDENLYFSPLKACEYHVNYIQHQAPGAFPINHTVCIWKSQ